MGREAGVPEKKQKHGSGMESDATGGVVRVFSDWS